MREWLSGGAPPCQGGGRGFDPRLALLRKVLVDYPLELFCVKELVRGILVVTEIVALILLYDREN